jgi:DNA (cytosine-5)-methyltransferase 1
MPGEILVEGAVKIGSLFSGIGGLDLGIEQATGGRVVWLCENDPYARAVLAKHWPGVPCYDDVRLLNEQTPAVDLVCGGFPCQDISYAGKGAGIRGARSGLWGEFARIVRLLRPRYVFVENVPALATRGLDVVLGDLAACGYDAEWDLLGACCVGAPHRRERLFILARHADRESEPAGAEHAEVAELPSVVADAECDGREQSPEVPQGGESEPASRGQDVADPDGKRQKTGQPRRDSRIPLRGEEEHGEPSPRSGDRTTGSWWCPEPDVGRVAHGIPRRVDRLRCLGNAVVPAQAAKAWELLVGRLV